ncbi:MAG: 4Fe-4S dicluster domain-containing protein [Armatimonadia bacterium]|nr:4Fe-4S dicluster domain-containing protein [Armatimonadia bacterium]
MLGGVDRLMATAGKPLSGELVKELERIPEGEKIKQCLQCGTCSASCPTAHAMDYTPRAVIAAMRAGELEKVLRSDTAWLCASCYSCTVRCPAGIQFTDMMYGLKRLGLKHGITPGDDRGLKLMSTFVEDVDESGRSSELWLMAKYFMRTGPQAALRDAAFAFNMWKNRRLKLKAERVQAAEQLKAINRALERRQG